MKKVCDRSRIGDAGGFDDDRVKGILALHQVLHSADQVTAHGAADAAVVHFEDFFVGFHEQIVIDADFAELVDDNRITLTVVFGQDPVEKGGFSGSEIARQNGDGDLCPGVLGRRHQATS